MEQSDQMDTAVAYIPGKTIYPCLAYMSEEGAEQKYVKEAFDTNWVVPLGPNVNGLEKDLELFVGENRRVVVLSVGTAAVHLALLACGVKPGDGVLVQSFTFCASSHPITYLGAMPAFVNPETDTWNMDPVLLEGAVQDRIKKTGKTPKAIVTVALYGMPYKVDETMAVADRYGIPIIEDAVEGFGSRYDGRMLGTSGKYEVLSLNGDRVITISGGGALICSDEAAKQEIMFYATQAREAYPHYQHKRIGHNYRMSDICAGIGRGQMTVADAHVAHRKHACDLCRELLRDVKGITLHENPLGRFDSNYWLNMIVLDPLLRAKEQENAYRATVQSAVGGAGGVTHAVANAHTDCESNVNVEAIRVGLDVMGIEPRPLWESMHKQPIYKDRPAYVNGVSGSLFGVGLCLPSGLYVTDEDMAHIVDYTKKNIL